MPCAARARDARGPTGAPMASPVTASTSERREAASGEPNSTRSSLPPDLAAPSLRPPQTVPHLPHRSDRFTGITLEHEPQTRSDRRNAS